jgi:tetratricopeptide (TPR) repeat protein
MKKILLFFLVLLAVVSSGYSQTAVEMGNAKYSQQDYKGAIENFTQAIWVDPKCSVAYINRGQAKTHLQDYTGALSDFTKAIALEPAMSAAVSIRPATFKIRAKDLL